MAKIRFEPSGFETQVEKGSRIVDLTDDNPKSGVPYSCRSASCGTCRVKVVEGLEAMAPAEDDELEVLEIFGNEHGVRLACQLRLAQETDHVVLEVVEPE